jgi:ABC-type multidrug transport system fused ATPase/permease subunit
MNKRILNLPQSINFLLNPAERMNFVVLVCMMLVGVVLETVGIGMVIPTISLFTRQDLAGHYPGLRPLLDMLGNPSGQTLVICGLLVIFGVYLVKTIYLSLLAWSQNRFIFGLEERLSLRLFTIYLHQPYVHRLQNNSARLIRNVSAEVSMFTNSVLTPVMQLLTESLIMVALFGILLRTEPFGTIVVMSTFGAVGWIFNRIVRKRVASWGESRQYHEVLRQQHLQQGLNGVKDVRLLGREAYFLERFASHNRESIRVGRLNTTIGQMPRLWLELMTVGGLFALVLTMLGKGGDPSGVLPKLGLFSVATFRLIPSVNRILFSSQILRYCSPVMMLLVDEFSRPDGQGRPAGARDGKFHESIELKNIAYSYPEARFPALRDLSMRIRCGQSIGIVGPSGSGKSTLVDIFLGLLEPERGALSVDGREVGQDVRWWQNQIGYVPQSIYLTDDTIRRNIAFGIPDELIDATAMEKAMQAACLGEFVASLPEGLDTVIGEHGARLSGGQRQRIGIARALYHDPSVLVLDEATSALDLATEKGVVDSIRALQGKKTIVIVAHRLSTIEHCDEVYSIRNGEIVERRKNGNAMPANVIGTRMASTGLGVTA